MSDLNSSGHGKDYRAEPIARSTDTSQTVQRQDPYVVRAMERAKTKIRDRMIQLNGGHAN